MSQPGRPQKLLIANRGEIAVRILKTAQKLNIPTLAIYTQPDITSPHVSLADEAIPLYANDSNPDNGTSNTRGYTDAEEILRVCITHDVTLVHPGYGFLSENAEFARAVQEKGMTWVGPRPDIVRCMGLKHEAREIAENAGVPIVPGSEGSLLQDVEEAVRVANEIGYPVLLKATAGGGGMGMVVCNDEEDIKSKFDTTKDRAVSMFHNGGLFVERYIVSARHIEVQVFGDGKGRVIHMGERECSVQRRHQKVIEESPSPYMAKHPDIRARLCQAAIDICASINYNSAGTVEFIIDDKTGEFFFLEMNTRIQVEHTVTEAICPGLDIIELMLHEAVANQSSASYTTLSSQLDRVQKHFEQPITNIWAIQTRVYCENPSANFQPTPGVLQHVHFPEPLPEWLRVDTWVQTGTSVTQFYDPLVAKIICSGETRDEALSRTLEALRECKIWGPPTNMEYLRAICEDDVFIEGQAMTTYLDYFEFTPRALSILNGGVEATIQDYPGRRLAMGIPRSGPMDTLALRIANHIVGNPEGTEGLEITLPEVGFRALFHVPAVVCITGADVRVTVNGEEVYMWSRVVVPRKSKLVIGKKRGGEGSGMRTYLAVRGGFPEVAVYLGSKSTSMGLGGYQGRSLIAGDQLALSPLCTPTPADSLPLTLPPHLIPSYPSNHWILYSLSGPHSSPDYITPSGISAFFSTHWTVSASSNRMGIRLEGSTGTHIEWARESGGEGGSHPSNILDNGYALGSVNVNGDTPVILGPEGPDMGGYVCVCTVASADMWKLGQLRPGDTVQFQCISFDAAQKLSLNVSNHLTAIKNYITGTTTHPNNPDTAFQRIYSTLQILNEPPTPILKSLETHVNDRPPVIFRQAGDSAILVEFGPPNLNLHIRARVHAFEEIVHSLSIPGVWALSPCIRSTMVQFNYTIPPTTTTTTTTNDKLDQSTQVQSIILNALIYADSLLPNSMSSITFPGRKITFPIVLDDKWTKDALERYSRSVRDEAVYLPSNVDYLARNNGLGGGREEALDVLVKSVWLVFGVGFYLGCPFLVPVDPRCQLVAQKMNPSRTYTPRGAVGIAGVVAAIYPIESPGGYQLFGRTLPPWQTWGRGEDFSLDEPWLLKPFDQIAFKVVTEAEYSDLEAQFDAGQYKFTIEPATFSMSSYDTFVTSIQPEVDEFRRRQAAGVVSEEIREQELLSRWETRKRAEREAELRKNSEVLVVSNIDETSSKGRVVCSVNASVWKLVRRPGYVVKTPEDVLLVLEAMKTEISVEAGEENVGRTIEGCVQEGAVVHPGQTLVYLS